MNDLKMLALVIGGVMALFSLPCVVMPRKSREWIKAFPRGKIPAWVLTALCVAWSAYLLYKMPLAWFDNYKPSLYVMAPLLFFLIVKFMDELLAPRALGGLLVLIPSPVLDIARQRGLLLVTLAYVAVIAGITLILSPYVFRKSMAFCIANDIRCRTFGFLGVVAGALVAVFGFLFY
jgi:uncharacterized protein YjeT (DUF2065 family)